MKITIAPDGSGDFSSLQAAVDAVPEYVPEGVTLFLRRGVYHERVVIHRDHLRLLGEDREGTVITASLTLSPR